MFQYRGAINELNPTVSSRLTTMADDHSHHSRLSILRNFEAD
jgi:hypothetical protein